MLFLRPVGLMSKSSVHAIINAHATDSDPGHDTSAAASVEVYSKTNILCVLQILLLQGVHDVQNRTQK